MREINRLNEEIARWGFEISFNENTCWTIAFTNPTAGPWKTVKGTNRNGTFGEVYRFILEEQRPDIIIYNDDLEVVIIFEAKDSIAKLLNSEQSSKSSEVVIKLAGILKNKGDCEFWGKRSKYKVLLGLLWGTGTAETSVSKEKLFKEYYEYIKNDPNVDSDIVIGVESIYANEHLSFDVYEKTFNSTNQLSNKIVSSLKK